MKTFVQEYGLIVVCTIIIMIFVVVASPVGKALSNGVQECVTKITEELKDGLDVDGEESGESQGYIRQVYKAAIDDASEYCITFVDDKTFLMELIYKGLSNTYTTYIGDDGLTHFKTDFGEDGYFTEDKSQMISPSGDILNRSPYNDNIYVGTDASIMFESNTMWTCGYNFALMTYTTYVDENGLTQVALDGGAGSFSKDFSQFTIDGLTMSKQ